jgi:hypothetical protein
MRAQLVLALAMAAYPPRYPQVSPVRRQQVVEQVRRQDPSPTVEADEYGFIRYVTGPKLTTAEGGDALVRRNAALFGIDDPNALKNVGGPQGIAYVQYLDNQIVAPTWPLRACEATDAPGSRPSSRPYGPSPSAGATSPPPD